VNGVKRLAMAPEVALPGRTACVIESPMRWG
jgi:hypothetical protein